MKIQLETSYFQSNFSLKKSIHNNNRYRHRRLNNKWINLSNQTHSRLNECEWKLQAKVSRSNFLYAMRLMNFYAMKVLFMHFLIIHHNLYFAMHKYHWIVPRERERERKRDSWYKVKMKLTHFSVSLCVEHTYIKAIHKKRIKLLSYIFLWILKWTTVNNSYSSGRMTKCLEGRKQATEGANEKWNNWKQKYDVVTTNFLFDIYFLLPRLPAPFAFFFSHSFLFIFVRHFLPFHGNFPLA